MANKNANLGAAKKNKKDEFYTQRADIENELRHYADHFRGKVVYCNCDDPRESEFWQFFVRNFTAWGLKKLIATHYEPNAENFSYKLEMEPDENGQFSMYQEPVKTPLPCNGDFRSAACIELLKEADIVVTNPPFSLFREYVAQLIEYDKKFLIIGNQSSITYKDFFPFIKEGKIWLGYGFPGNVGFFRSPYEDYAVSSQHKDGLIRVSGVMWFTNLDIPKRHQPLDLRGNYYNPEKFPKIINYDAIDVKDVADIPDDYDGIMSVPVTFLPKYCPEQFEIIGCGDYKGLYGTDYIGVSRIGEEWIAKYRSQGGKGHYTANMTSLVYYDSEGNAKAPFKRILIRRKRVT